MSTLDKFCALIHNSGVKRTTKILSFGVILISVILLNTSCSKFLNPCSSLLKDLKGKEAFGQILFSEFELQLNRYKEESPYPLRLKESAEDLLTNYVEVHELLLEKPQCLVKPELEAVIREGVSEIEAGIEQVKKSHDNAFVMMLGELSEAYQSMELWVKK